MCYITCRNGRNVLPFFKVLKIKMTSNNNSKKHWFALKVFYNKVFAIEELLLKKKDKNVIFPAKP